MSTRGCSAGARVCGRIRAGRELLVLMLEWHVLWRIARAPLNTEHQKMGQSFSKLRAQHNENEMVLKELKLLGEDAKVYKLTGPVLLNQVRCVASLPRCLCLR